MNVEPVSLLEGLSTTRAIRRYTDAPIPDGDLSTILWHAGRAPSGSNRQPFRFLVLRDGSNAVAAKSLLGATFRAGWSAKREAECLRKTIHAVTETTEVWQGDSRGRDYSGNAE